MALKTVIHATTPPVVIAAHTKNRAFLHDLLSSLRPSRYPLWVFVGDAGRATPEWISSINDHLTVGDRIVAVFRNGFISAVIESVVDITDAEEFLLLEDNCVVRNCAFLDTLFNDLRGKSVALSPGLCMQMGKYCRKHLLKCPPPYTSTMREELELGEQAWTKRYIAACGDEFHTLWPNFVDRPVFEDRHGRRNMVLENEYLVKYKGHWTPSMIGKATGDMPE